MVNYTLRILNEKSAFVMALVSFIASLRVTSPSVDSSIYVKNPCWEDDFPLGLDEFSGFLEVLSSLILRHPQCRGQNWGGRTARRAPASFGRLGLVPRKFQPFTESGFIHLTAGMPCVPVFKENLRNDWDSRPSKSVYKKIIEVWKMSLL